MAQTIATSLEKLNTALEGDKAALIGKKVAVPDDTKHSNVPDLIALVKAGAEEGQSGQITVNCSSEYEGAIMTFTNGDAVIKESVSNGKCVVYPKKEGQWTITNNKDDQVLTCVVEFIKNSLVLNWIPITYVETGDGQTLHSGIVGVDNYTKLTKIKVTDEKAPSSAKLRDISKAQDKSVCAWSEGDTLIISSQKPKARVQFAATYHYQGMSLEWGDDYYNEFSIFASVYLSREGGEESGEYVQEYVTMPPIQSIDLSNADFSKTTSLRKLFQGLNKVQSIDFSQATGLDGGHITDTSCLFYNCSSLNEINLGDLDTRNVTDMSNMFGNTACNDSNIKSVIGKLNTKSVKNMGAMFAYMKNVTTLDLSKFITTNVTNMASMFYHCESLSSLNLSGFNTANVTSMISMFGYCTSLPNLNMLSGFDTRNVENMSSMFAGLNLRGTYNLSNFSYDNVKEAYGMFENSAFDKINMSRFYGTKTLAIGHMFNGCPNLTEVDMRNFSVTNLRKSDQRSLAQCFGDCPKLTTIYATNWSSRTDLNSWYVFKGSTSLPNYVARDATAKMAKPISQGGCFTTP